MPMVWIIRQKNFETTWRIKINNNYIFVCKCVNVEIITFSVSTDDDKGKFAGLGCALIIQDFNKFSFQQFSSYYNWRKWTASNQRNLQYIMPKFGDVYSKSKSSFRTKWKNFANFFRTFTFFFLQTASIQHSPGTHNFFFYDFQATNFLIYYANIGSAYIKRILKLIYLWSSFY